MSTDRRHHSESGLRCQAHSETIGSGGVNSDISNHLSLELQLRDKCRELLDSYKESQNWAAVGQLAQTLVSNSTRINDLKRRLKELADFPYLEGIPESDNSISHPYCRSPKGVPDDSTFQEASEVGKNKPANLRKQGESLPKVSEAVIDKQDLRELVASSSEGVECSEANQGEVCPPAPAENKLPTPSPEGSSQVNSDSEAALAAAVLENGTPTPGTPTPDEPQPEDIAGPKGVNDIDEITDLMEDLADQFSDLSKQYELQEESEPHPPLVENGIGAAELAVPKSTDASSESSDQFFSPRDSLYGGGESEGVADDNEFVDAMSTNDSQATRVDVPPSIFSIIEVLVDSTSDGDGQECSSTTAEVLYCVESKKEVAMAMSMSTFPPVVRSYQDFEQLHKQLTEVGASPPNLIDPSGAVNHSLPLLERFLNHTSCSSDPRQTEIFLSFFKDPKSTPNCGMLLVRE